MATVADADSACQSAATAAALQGSFRALLASGGASAISRFNTSAATWYRVDGVAIAASPDALAAGNTLAALNVHADGTFGTPGFYFWTGALLPNVNGSDPTTCRSWSRSTNQFTGTICDYSQIGVPSFAVVTMSCAATQQLFCLQQ